MADSTYGIYLLHQRDQPLRGREFPEIKPGHPLAAAPCPACSQPLADGRPVTLLTLGPGNDPEDQEKHASGSWYTAAGIPVHSACLGVRAPEVRGTTVSGVKIDSSDPAFNMAAPAAGDVDETLPAIYLFSVADDGDGPAYAIAEDGTILGSHICSHWGYMRHDLHDRPDQKAAAEKHYPGGYRLVVLTTAGARPPEEVLERNRQQGRDAEEGHRG